MRSIDVSFGSLPPIGELEREWRDLEARADCSFFTSWSWIGCWLENLPATLEPKLLRAQIGTRAVGLAIFVPRTVHRHKALSSRALYLHATGDAQFDALTIESNGLLVDRAQADAIAHRMIEHLATECLHWEELFLEATSIPLSPAFEGTILRLRRWEQPTYYIDLVRIGLGDSDHSGLLRPKVRHQIRRSIRAYAEHGVVRARAAADLKQALEFFDLMKALHQANWVAKGLPGAFASAFMCRFHTRLISRCFDRGEIQLLLVEAGERPIGYLYNFVHRGVVSNYQSGIDYESAAINNSPGLAAHFLCARFNASAGYRVYDLMMGDYEYKKRICTDTRTLYWTVVQRPRLKFRVEDALRSLKRRATRYLHARPELVGSRRAISTALRNQS